MGFLARRLCDALARVRPTHLEPLAVLAAALALNGLLARGARPGEVGFAGLEPGQRMKVVYESHGCFHSDRATISLKPEPGGRLRYSTSSVSEMGRSSRSGVLDPSEVARLERGLAAYRRGSDCWSTTTQKVTLTVYERGNPVRTERHRRHFCMDEADVPDFAELLPR